MTLLVGARDLLAEDDIEFVASLGQLESDVVGPWTLRDALVVASGCDRRAGPFAYWEHREVDAAIGQVWHRLAGYVDAPTAQGWSSTKGREKAEILAALDAALDDGDIAGPSAVTMRPWCTTKLVRTCRIPFVPLAAVMHSWAERGGSLQHLLEHHQIDASTDPWTVLDRVEPSIRTIPAPDDAALLADYLRGRMRDAVPEVYSPASLLADMDPGLTLDGLREMSVAPPSGS